MGNTKNFINFIGKEVKIVEEVLSKKEDTFDVLPPKLKNFVNETGTGKSVRIKIEDPQDFIPSVDGNNSNFILKWTNTILVRKIGSYPVDEEDGTVLVNNYERNHYNSGESFIVNECTTEELNQGVYYKAWAIFENNDKGTSEELSQFSVNAEGGGD